MIYWITLQWQNENVWEPATICVEVNSADGSGLQQIINFLDDRYSHCYEVESIRSMDRNKVLGHIIKL